MTGKLFLQTSVLHATWPQTHLHCSLRLVVVGTEADDSYVVTDGQVFGGGLTISYTNIEALEVTGEAGDDTITVLSTSPSLVT